MSHGNRLGFGNVNLCGIDSWQSGTRPRGGIKVTSRALWGWRGMDDPGYSVKAM